MVAEAEAEAVAGVAGAGWDTEGPIVPRAMVPQGNGG